MLNPRQLLLLFAAFEGILIGDRLIQYQQGSFPWAAHLNSRGVNFYCIRRVDLPVWLLLRWLLAGIQDISQAARRV
jgi:hypothetical protein